MKKLSYTPRSRIRSALRQLFLRSKERAAVVKRDKNTCTSCGKKGSVAKGKEVKIEVHHLEHVAWEEMIDMVYERLLVNPDKMICLCKDCHDKETNK